MPCLQCCTEGEAYNISIFFNELFQLLANWNDEAKFRQVIINALKIYINFEILIF